MFTKKLVMIEVNKNLLVPKKMPVRARGGEEEDGNKHKRRSYE